jgi:hypothetical protein
MSDSEQVDWELLRADSHARQGFYKALRDEAERAFRRGAALPVVPPNDELAFVDGFLIWNGRPVWWSGEGTTSAATSKLDRPGFVNTDMFTTPAPRPVQAQRHPGFLRWFRLRRRLA